MRSPSLLRQSSPVWSILVDEFLSDCKAHLASKTAKFYTDQLRLFVRWAESEEIRPDRFRAKDLNDYLIYRESSHVSPTTRAHDARAVCRLMEHSYRSHLLSQNPLRDYHVRKPPTIYMPIPSLSDVGKVFDAIEEDWKSMRIGRHRNVEDRVFYCRRDQAILAFLIGTGMRIGEVLSLSLLDYDREKMLVNIRESKGRRPRPLPIDAIMCRYADQWLKVRPRRSPTDYLFVNEYGEAVSYRTFHKSFARYLEKAGLPHYRLHSIRSAVLNEIARTGDFWAAVLAAGHTDPKTTRVHYLRGDPDFLREKMGQANPLGKALSRNISSKPTRKKII